MSSAMPSVTVVLLSWHRPQNIPLLLDCLAGQTLQPRVIIVDNGWGGAAEEDRLRLDDHPLVDLVIRHTKNLGCFPRWHAAAQTDCEYICTLDDDLLLADPRVLEDAIAAQEEECPDGIVGFYGWSGAPGRSYRRGRHFRGTKLGTRCDIIKGRFMVLRRRLLERVPLLIPGVSLREDDIYVSLCISRGQPDYHLIPRRLGCRCKNLPGSNTGASAEPGHWLSRHTQVKALTAHFEIDRIVKQAEGRQL
ncbi:MAG: glycosyltransferase [Acidobacteriota bacterium]